MPGFIKPQLATLKSKAPQGEQWIHEIKYDGYRIGCFIEEGKVRLMTRNGQNYTAALPEVVTAAKTLGVTQPRISDLLRGRIDLFSTDALIDMLTLLGATVRLTVKVRPAA